MSAFVYSFENYRASCGLPPARIPAKEPQKISALENLFHLVAPTLLKVTGAAACVATIVAFKGDFGLREDLGIDTVNALAGFGLWTGCAIYGSGALIGAVCSRSWVPGPGEIQNLDGSVYAAGPGYILSQDMENGFCERLVENAMPWRKTPHFIGKMLGAAAF